MKTEDKFTSCLGWIITFGLAGIVSVFVDGWALSTIWNWFMPNIFHVVTLSLMQAVGVAMVFSLFTRTNQLHNSEGSKEKGLWAIYEILLRTVVTALLNLGIAWIVLQFAF